MGQPKLQINTLRLRQNGRHFADAIFKFIFLNEKWWNWNKNSLKNVPYGKIDNKSVLVEVMAWCLIGNKSLSELMLTKMESSGHNELTHWPLGELNANGIFNLVLLIVIFRSSHDNALRWIPQDLTDDKSTLVQVMAWCRQAASHYLSQCWLSS